MMRYLTYETSSAVVDLGREIEYISNFIELHRIMIKTPEEIKFEIHGDQNINYEEYLNDSKAGQILI